MLVPATRMVWRGVQGDETAGDVCSLKMHRALKRVSVQGWRARQRDGYQENDRRLKEVKTCPSRRICVRTYAYHAPPCAFWQAPSGLPFRLHDSRLWVLAILRGTPHSESICELCGVSAKPKRADYFKVPAYPGALVLLIDF